MSMIRSNALWDIGDTPPASNRTVFVYKAYDST